MPADHSEVLRFQKRMAAVAREIDQLSPLYGLAKTVVAYDSDRRKQILAEVTVSELKKGDVSHAEAETRARANPEYKEKINAQFEELSAANRTISRWDALHCSWDTGRSLLAMQRETFRNLPGTEDALRI